MLKRNFILIVICLLYINNKGQITFNNYYKTGYNNFFSTNIFPQPDSSNIIFNYLQDSATGRQDLGILKINKQGNLLVNKTFNINNVNYLAYINGLKQFIPATNNSFLAVSGTYTNTNTTIIFTKINKTTLDTIKNTFYYDGTYNYYVNNFIKLNDNKYYLIGGKGNTTTEWPVIFHLDSNLTIINIITLNNPINLSCTNAVINPITKKLLFSGTITYNTNKINVGFIEADTLGVISNTAIINYNGAQGISQLRYSNFDNSYVFNGSKRTSKYGSTSMLRLNITKLNSTNLNVIWAKTYGSAAITNNCNSFVINTDGSIVTCGRYADSTSLPLMNYDIKGVILKVSAVGDSLWMRQYNNYQTPPNPLNYFETFFGIEKTYDGGYIACGGVINQPQGKAWVLKTDSLGCISAGCGSVINGTPTIISGIKTQEKNEEAQSISIYPNPANDILNIELVEIKIKDYRLEIVNNLGQVVYQSLIINHHSSIVIKELPSGIYFINIFSKNGLIEAKKIVKE